MRKNSNEIMETGDDIYNFACLLLNECWKGEPVRHLGVSVSRFGKLDCQQLSLFGDQSGEFERNSKLDHTLVLFKGKEKPMPYKFKYIDHEGIRQEIKIDKILHTEASEEQQLPLGIAV